MGGKSGKARVGIGSAMLDRDCHDSTEPKLKLLFCQRGKEVVNVTIQSYHHVLVPELRATPLCGARESPMQPYQFMSTQRRIQLVQCTYIHVRCVIYHKHPATPLDKNYQSKPWRSSPSTTHLISKEKLDISGSPGQLCS